MSVFRPEFMRCPECGHDNEETVAVSLHGPRVPEVVDAIVDGTFQCFDCRGCGLPYRADGPILYIDFERKHWIGEMPIAMERDWALLEQQPLDVFRQSLLDLAPAFLRSEADGFSVRAVFGLEALAEKILLLTAGLDDHSIEIAKFATILQTGALLSPTWRSRVVRVADGRVTLIVWHADRDGPPTSEHVDVPFDEIDRIGAHPDWRRLRGELSIGPYVDIGRTMMDGRAASIGAPV